MNVSILKRLAAIESKVQKPEAVPSLIMIGYDEGRKQWSISETYSSGTGKLPKMQDSFTRLACMMIICDVRYQEGREKE